MRRGRESPRAGRRRRGLSVELSPEFKSSRRVTEAARPTVKLSVTGPGGCTLVTVTVPGPGPGQPAALPERPAGGPGHSESKLTVPPLSATVP